MLFLKWIILTSIFLTSLILGFAYGDKYTKRVYYLRELLQAIKLLKTEVILLSNPLPISFENISKKTEGNVKNIFDLILKDMVEKDREEIYQSFLGTEKILEKDCFLVREDIDLFINLGKVIGKTERMDQERHFTHIIEELIITIGEAKVEKDKNQKMYRSLGLLMGLGAIIILI